MDNKKHKVKKFSVHKIFDIMHKLSLINLCLVFFLKAGSGGCCTKMKFLLEKFSVSARIFKFFLCAVYKLSF